MTHENFFILDGTRRCLDDLSTPILLWIVVGAHSCVIRPLKPHVGCPTLETDLYR